MSKKEIIIYEYTGSPKLLNIYEISRFVEVHPMLIEKLFQLGLIDPQVEEPELLFEDRVIAKIDKIMRLKNDLGVNFAGCGLVLDLLEKIAVLEKKLLYYERRFQK